MEIVINVVTTINVVTVVSSTLVMKHPKTGSFFALSATETTSTNLIKSIHLAIIQIEL
jgi:hypothetical protein